MTAYGMLTGKPFAANTRANELALKLYRSELASIDDESFRAQAKQHFGHTDKSLAKRKKELVKLIAELGA